MTRTLTVLVLGIQSCLAFGQTSSLSYLDEFCDPYYPNRTFPKLTTPQWVGEEGVECVVTLGIDDMRDTRGYEAYLRPILDRLKKIDGRAPVSIMTCIVNPNDSQLQTWVKEGLSIEVHTIDHPCPLLHDGDFDRARSTYERCVDLMNQIPGNKPVAFRMPCCDSLNTPSPRFWTEIFNKTTDKGNYLSIDTSVFHVFTPKDTSLPRDLTIERDGKNRFRKYIPFPSFVNTIEDYPYPYVIGGRCWEFPCVVPSDWEAQNLHRPNNPVTVADMKAAIDATVLKKGTYNLVFHPHGWIRNDQVIEIIDHAVTKYGKKVKFLTFREALDRLNKHLLAGQPIRNANGGDNGVRLLDLNSDGFLDVAVGNGQQQLVRIWRPNENKWADSKLPFQIDRGTRFGVLSKDKLVSALTSQNGALQHFTFRDGVFERQAVPDLLRNIDTAIKKVDQGVRLRDLDGDGISEILVGGQQNRRIVTLAESGWKLASTSLPAAIVNRQGGDNGVRFVDIDRDGFDDLIVSNGKQSGVHLYETKSGGFSKQVTGLDRLPTIAVDGINSGAWFAKEHIWFQNENTNRMPDLVDRRSFVQLLGDTDPSPQGPQQSLRSIHVRPGFRVELVAAEPLVMDPIALDWGAEGKLWVVEMADYPLGLDDRGKPGGRVRYLEDTDGDGQYDKSTVFLDGIAYPTGVMAWRDGVLVSAAPSVFFARDDDGDGKADTRTVLYRGFGEGNQQHRVNGFEWGLDNWIYLANGDSGGTIESVKTGHKVDIRGRDLRIRPDDGSIEALAGQTQFGRHRDDHGNWFGCANPLPVRHYVLSDRYQRRNPHVAGPALHRDLATAGNTQLFPISRVISHWSGYRSPAVGQSHRFTSACSTSVYRGSMFGSGFEQNTFTCAPVHNTVHRRKLLPDGLSFKSVRPDDESDFEFLASNDSWFRPTTVTTGPDGALWITDMYRLVIEHPQWIDDQREKELFLRAGHDRGRIYRVFPEDSKLRPVPRLDKLTSKQLVSKLGSSNGRIRDMAQRLLIERNDRSVVDQLRETTKLATSPMSRLHALCTLDGLDAADNPTLVAAIDDTHPTVRRHAIRISERNETMLPAMQKRVDDDDPHVLLQLAYSLGESSNPLAIKVMADIALKHSNDTLLRAAIVSSLNKANVAAFYGKIAVNAEAAAAYRQPVFAMASRLNDAKLLSEILSGVIGIVDSQNLDAKFLQEFVAIFTAVQEIKFELSVTTTDKLDELCKAALEIVEHGNDASTRNAAIRFLSVAPNKLARTSRPLLIQLVDTRQPIGVQRAVLESLTDSDTPHIKSLLGRFSRLSPIARTILIDQLMSRKSWTSRLITSLKNGTIKPQDIGALHRQRLLSHSDAQLKAAAVDLFGAPASTDKVKLLADYQARLLKKPNVEKGRGIFVKRCSVCHQLSGVGHIVGPDLTTIKNRSTTAMLTAVLDPNRAVEDKYRSYVIRTVNGRSETGIIASETSSSITLQMQEGKRRVILRNDIEEIRTAGKSLMPDGLEKDIDVVAMSHLLAYLNELGPPPKKFAGNNPATVRPSKDNNLRMTANMARIYGPNAVFESKYKNIGFWSHVKDKAEWTAEIVHDAKYEVWLDYACADDTAGNTAAITIEDQTITSKINGTGSWDNYETVRIGVVQLKPGSTIVSLRAGGNLRGFLIDLRGIHLKPIDCCGK